MSIQSPSPRTREPDLNVLSYLRAREIGKHSKASTIWRKIGNNETLMEQMFPHNVGASNRPRERYIVAANSRSEILDRLQTFANRLSENQKGSFICIYPLNPQYTLQITVGFGNAHPAEKEDHVKEYCIFTRFLKRVDMISADHHPEPTKGLSFIKFYNAFPILNDEATPSSAFHKFRDDAMAILKNRGDPPDPIPLRIALVFIAVGAFVITLGLPLMPRMEAKDDTFSGFL